MSLSLFTFGLGFVDLSWFFTLRINVLFFVVCVLFIVASFHHLEATFVLLVFSVKFIDAFELLDFIAVGFLDLTNLVFDLLVNFIVLRVSFLVGLTLFSSSLRHCLFELLNITQIKSTTL
jgi:hypothetical protein